MAELDKVIKAYDSCKNPWNRKCDECPFEKECCHDGLPTFLIKDALELLKEQQKIVRCKDCRFTQEPIIEDYIGKRIWCNRLDKYFDNDWFCADGERKDE